jgi:hypothetical protein|tara:strand:- start:16514 stop:16669 length:156 start_codon:yes stop_codon:yes gene_type:complete
MLIENAKYINEEETEMRVTIDGALYTVPKDLSNRHYKEIVAQEISIAAYEA